ncbi:hypothetical protein Tcan_00199 [Toxocara canis]|uniref:Uncharacterized protein n=1 Tax=Toxocara canis TaxID=6265 RepID=A0A0B2VMS3_TOXCA|nr:hypothetical protein Tcan_00199 [Toxocara canis]
MNHRWVVVLVLHGRFDMPSDQHIEAMHFTFTQGVMQLLSEQFVDAITPAYRQFTCCWVLLFTAYGYMQLVGIVIHRIRVHRLTIFSFIHQNIFDNIPSLCKQIVIL